MSEASTLLLNQGLWGQSQELQAPAPSAVMFHYDPPLATWKHTVGRFNYSPSVGELKHFRDTL